MEVDPLDYEGACHRIMEVAQEGGSRYVCVANVHMVMEAFDSPAFREVVNGAELVTPDGMPLVWALRALGNRRATQVRGADLVLHLAARAASEEIPVGVYGGAPEILEDFAQVLQGKFPKLEIACKISPPFRSLTVEEDEEITREIASSGARVLFVGLGCPKQERWMAEHEERIPAVMLGVGAAFDFHAGWVRQAPHWMQRLGLEWTFRLLMDPKRLWKRYVKHNPRFVFLFVLQLIKYRTFPKSGGY